MAKMEESMVNQDALEMTEQNPATGTQENQEAEPTEQEKPKKKSGRHLTPQEQLAHIAEQQKQLAARARQIRAREDAKERKARAHRLIQIGGVAEAVFGAPIEGADMLSRFEAFLRQQDERGGYFSNALKG